MRILQVQQGSDSWHAERAKRFTASEAPAMMGVSKYTSRSALLHQKATGIVPEVSAHQQALFDRGHAAEAGARAIVEEMIGEELFPCTAVHDAIEWLLASLDGATMTEEKIMEHKLWSESLAAQVRAQDLEPHYYFQLEQQLLVSGAEVCIFVCSDGTREKFVSMEYRPVPGRREALLAGWQQFRADLAAYVAPAEVKERPKADVTIALPALVIHAKGEITTSNMKEYGTALAKRLAEVRAIQLVTDQDFSNAKESAKLLRENIQQAQLAKDAMLAQTVTVGEAARMIDAWCEDMRLTALQLEKDVEREDKAKKTAMVLRGQGELAKHVASLEQRLRDLLPEGTVVRENLLPPIAADFAGAIKGKRSFANMESAVSDEAARCKVEANKACELREKNLGALQVKAGAHRNLFADWRDLIGKDAELVELTIGQRIQAEKAAEERRMEAERERIRREEAARLEREQAEREAAARREQEAAARAEELRQAALRQSAEQLSAAAMPDLPAVRAAGYIPLGATPAPVDNVVPMPTKAPASAPSLKLGDIQKRLAPLSIDAAGLALLGFPFAAQQGASKLYHEHDFARICVAIAVHAQTAARRHEQKAA